MRDAIWVADFKLADSFADTKSALKACEDFDLDEAEMVLVLGKVPSERDVVLPIVLGPLKPNEDFSE